MTYAALIPGYTTIDQKTITVWVQLAIGSGVYAAGGVPSGVVSLVSGLSIDSTTFLDATVESELTLATSGSSYVYRYVPSTDKLQIFQYTNSSGATVELSGSAIIPAGVLTDTIVAQMTYNRL